MVSWLLAAAMVLATLPLWPAAASASGGVTENPDLTAVAAGKVIWTDSPQMFFQVSAPNGVAQPTVTFGGAPLAPAGSNPMGGGGTNYQYNVAPLPSTQALTVSYSVYGTPYQDSALVGLDNSIFEWGPPSATTVSFTLFAHGGGTVSGASIQVNYNQSSPTLIQTANPNGSVSVSFSPAGGVSGSAHMQVSYSDTLGNQYQAGGQPSTAAQWLTGAVTDTGGNPIPGVQVQAFSQSGFGQAFTGGDGHFLMPLQGTGTYQVQINPQGLPYVGQQTSVTISAGANALPSAVQLATPAATVSGVVYDGTTNQPLPNAFVNMFEMIQNSGPQNGPPPGGQGVTDAAGHFSIALPAAGQYGMNVQPQFGQNPHNLVTYTATENVVAGNQTVDVVLQQANATVSGTVYAGGQPVANAPVNFINMGGSGFAFGQTDGNGSYTIPIGQGTWMLQVNGQTAGAVPLQDLNMQQTVTPSADLSSGQLVVGSGTGQSITDDVTFTPYDVPLDIAVTVGGTAAPAAFAFATQGGLGPGGPQGGPGVFAMPTMNSDGTAGDYSTTQKLHLHLTAGTWQVAAGSGNPMTGGVTIPRIFTVTITGSGASAQVSLTGRGVSLTQGSPDLATVAMSAHNQVVTVTVLGTVGGTPDQPIQGAFVGAFNDKGDFIPGDGAPPQTASNGQDTIHVSKGLWNAVVMAPGYGISAPEQVDTSGGAGTYSVTINLGAQLPYTISGTVKANGSPVMGAEVVATQAGQPPVSTTSDPTGSYSLNVSAGIWALTVHSRQYDTSGIAPVDSPSMSAGTSTATVDLDISSATQRGATLSGTVYEPDGKTPLAGATVSAILSGHPGVPPVTAMTGNDGTWKMAVSAGTWSVGAIAPGYLPSASQSEAVTSGTTSGISLTVGATLPDTLTGTVTDGSSNAIANAVVTASDPGTHAVFQALTGSDGTYTIAVADGSYMLHVHAAGYTDAASAAAESVSGGSTATKNFQLSAGEAVSGTVTVSGAATGGVEVDAVNAANPSEIVTATTAADGTYSLNLTNGTWNLTAYSPVTQTTSTAKPVTVNGAPVPGQNLSIQ